MLRKRYLNSFSEKKVISWSCLFVDFDFVRSTQRCKHLGDHCLSSVNLLSFLTVQLKFVAINIAQFKQLHTNFDCIEFWCRQSVFILVAKASVQWSQPQTQGHKYQTNTYPIFIFALNSELSRTFIHGDKEITCFKFPIIPVYYEKV